jgi:Holliday junction DNA helicase RuvA
MYDHVAGRLTSLRPDRAVVETGGVGWRIHIPLSTYERLPRRESAEVRLLVVHFVREDRQALYGFATEEEREFFEILNTVSGVGPSLGLAFLSAFGFEEFRAAVIGGDGAALTRVKGVGKKLAARLVLELAGPLRERGPVGAARPAAAGTAADAALALVALGFERREAEEAAAEGVAALGPGSPAGEIVRRALQRARG